MHFQEIKTQKLTLAHWKKILIHKTGSSEDLISLASEHKSQSQKLWQTFIHHSPKEQVYFEEEKFLISYLLSFHLANATRMQVLWERLLKRIDLSHITSVEIWDIGCGTGAGYISVLDTFLAKNISINLHLVDRSQNVLDLHTPVLKNLDLPLTLNTYCLDSFQKLPCENHNKLTLILLSYSISELPETERFHLQNWICSNPNPTMSLWLDASDEIRSKMFMKIRNEMLSKSQHIVYPCPHQKPCPLIGTHNWCYTESKWQRPAEQVTVDKVLNHPRNIFTMSAYAFAHPKAYELLSIKRAKDVFIGAPKDTKNKQLLRPLFCNRRGSIDKRYLIKTNQLKYLRGEEKTTSSNS